MSVQVGRLSVGVSFAGLALGQRMLSAVAVQVILGLFGNPEKAVLATAPEPALAGGQLVLEWCTVVSTLR